MKKRVFWVVLDGVGAGAQQDAAQFGDTGSNTLGHLARAFKSDTGRALSIPNLADLGIAAITPMEGVPEPSGNVPSAFGKAAELSQGKDTTSGHWEMAGLVVKEAMATFPNGFPEDIVNQWVKDNRLPGVLGNKSASGTQIIDELGAEHIETLKPILYTSADSVWQVAAHEGHFGLERLYAICKSARKLCDKMNIGRVIARPFIGEGPFTRTYNRKDLSMIPTGPTVLDALAKAKIETLGIGKISSIFAGRGINSNIDTEGNTDGLNVLLEQVKSGNKKDKLVYCNLIDFDMLYGHRRDPLGFGRALEELDRALPLLTRNLRAGDLLLFTADHGNDPTYRGTDHTREFVPILMTSPDFLNGSQHFDARSSFADIGATVSEWLGVPPQGTAGSSLLKQLNLR